MKHNACLIILALLLLVAPLRADVRQVEVDQSANTRVTSPDGRWQVIAIPPKTEDGDPSLVLSSVPGKQTRTLCDYFRSGTVAWSADSKWVVFLDAHSVEDTRLRLFPVARPGSAATRDAVDRKIRRMAKAAVRPNEVLFYNLDITAANDDIVTVLARVRTVSAAKPEAPGKRWEGVFEVRLESGEVTRRSFRLVGAP